MGVTRWRLCCETASRTLTRSGVNHHITALGDDTRHDPPGRTPDLRNSTGDHTGNKAGRPLRSDRHTMARRALNYFRDPAGIVSLLQHADTLSLFQASRATNSFLMVLSGTRPFGRCFGGTRYCICRGPANPSSVATSWTCSAPRISVSSNKY